MTENEEYLSLREKLRLFASSKPTKEILVAHAILFIIGGIVYLTSSTFAFVVFFAVSSFTELVCFHVLWIYRDNRDKSNPIQYAVKKEILNIVIALGSVAVFIAVNILASTILNFPTLLPSSLLIVLLFFGFAKYKIYKAKIPKDRPSE